MNKAIIIGNLVRDPVLGTTTSGKSVCNFTVAVNRRKKADGTQETDFFQVHAWNELGEHCAKYLTKGRKVSVVGPVSTSLFTGNDGNTRANLDITATEVEFLTSSGQTGSDHAPQQTTQGTSPASVATPVESDELPF